MTINPGDRLPNGALVLARHNDTVLAFRANEYVTWTVDPEGNATGGKYFVARPNNDADLARQFVAASLNFQVRSRVPWSLSEEDKPYGDYAKHNLNEEGILEFDDAPVVSRTEEGAYVQCWAWVDEWKVQD